MVALGWGLFVVALPQAMAATECLVGCTLNGTSPLDDENVAVWDLRAACDPSTIGCDARAINYPPFILRLPGRAVGVGLGHRRIE